MGASGNYIVESDVDNWPVAIDATENFAIGAVDIDNDRITVANDVPTGTELKFSSTGALPAPLVTGTVYYAFRVDGTHIEVTTNPVDAAAGTQIDLTDVGSGTHTLDIGSGSSQTERQATIDTAEQLIERLTHDYFYTKAFALFYDGNGKDRLFLKLTPDVLSVTEILISATALDTSWWTYDNNSVYLTPDAQTGEQAELHLRMKYEQVLFPKGMGNVKVTGTYGWSSCPSAIKQAAIMLCRYDNDETLYTKYDDLVSDRTGDAGYARGNKKFLSGLQEVDRLVRPFVRRKPILATP